MMSTLFLVCVHSQVGSNNTHLTVQYVGITEIKRQWVESHADAGHHRPKGDGHDNMWAKLIEFVLWCVWEPYAESCI